MAQVYPSREHVRKTVSKLLEILPEEGRSKDQIIYVQGASLSYRHDTDRELPFRQESNFFYLTGCNVPQSSVFIVHRPATSTTLSKTTVTLLIPPEDPLDTMWSLPPPSLDEAKGTHDVDEIRHTTELTDILGDTLLNDQNRPLLHIIDSALFPPLTASFVKSGAKSASTSTYLLSALHHARLIKTPHEISLVRKANAISSRAHEVVMNLLGKGAGKPLRNAKGGELPEEWRIEKEAEAEAVFVASCRREGAYHQAYLPIVASANRASTLHYCCNDRDFAWGPLHTQNGATDLLHQRIEGEQTLAPQVLLIDAGCEWNNYASDITRTTPVGNGGKFTSHARDIYSLVLKMQNDAIDSLKPGLHWDFVQHQCHVTLVKGFLALGIFVGDEKSILESGVSSAFFPHGVGHSLGLDVHDVPSASKPGKNPTIPSISPGHPSLYTYLRLRLPLQAGMVLTVEPGIYFSPHLLRPVRGSPYINHSVLEKYESVGGVRIEDVLLITENGSENLSPARKDVEFLEKVCSGVSV